MEHDEQVSGNGGAGAATATIPPYIPFQTFLTFLKQLKTDGLPPQIDKSVLSKFSGGTQGQLKVALKALGLMDESRPTDDLEALVDAFDTPDFEPLLLKLLHRTYPYVFAIDLTTATPTMFTDSFKATGAKEDVSRKCRTFFLHAAKRAGVPLGNRILTGSVPRAANTSPKTRRKSKPKDDATKGMPPPPAGKSMSNEAMEYKLVDLMKEPDIEADQREAIWTLIQYLTSKKAKKAADQK